MTVEEFLYESADSLRNGDYLDPQRMLPVLDDCREVLEQMVVSTEDSPSPQGLEGLDQAIVEACEFLAEGLDLLELAVTEDIPELASEIMVRAQDGKETLREVRRQAETHVHNLQEEIGQQV